MYTLNPSRLQWATTGLITAALLSACGGGDTPSLNGVAATGAAIVGGAVQAKCASGPAVSGTTGSDGSFSLDLNAGQTAPCMLQVTGGTPTVTLHSFATAAGRVNITPASDLVVTNALGSAPATAFASFSAATGTTIGAKLEAAKTYVGNQLKAITGQTFSADVLQGAFKVGDADDKILDALDAALKTSGNKTLDDLRQGAIQGSDLKTIVPSQGGGATTGTAGYPASASYTGKLSDGTACTVEVAADHTLTVSASSWAYTGGSVKTTLDGFYFDNTNGEIAPAVVYTGTRRFYESIAGDYAKASASAPAMITGLSTDATSGKLIQASGSVITDNGMAPAAGANFSFVCVGEAFPANAVIAPSEYNKATPSRFKATDLVGTFNAPTAKNQACSFKLDAQGNASITWEGFTTTKGTLDLPSLWLTGETDQTTTQAKYDIYYNKTTGVLVGTSGFGGVIINSSDVGTYDSFSVTISKQGSDKNAVVLANGLGNDAKSVTCSTANDPAIKWSQVAAYSGTWAGTKDTNFHFGSNATCQLAVGSDGAMTYTDTAGAQTVISSAAWTVTPNGNGSFNFAKTGTNVTFDMDFTGTNDSKKPQAYFWKTGASTEYCNSMAKP